MFNNLIESSSHTRELKRRGSFFLYTVAAYVLLFTTAGVASIYAYDAQLENQSTDLEVIVFVPPDFAADVHPAAPFRSNPSPVNGNPHTTVPTLPVLYESSSNPHTAPVNVATGPVNFPPAGPGTRLGPTVSNPLSSGGPGNSTGTPGGTGDHNVVDIEVPPPAPPVKKVPPTVLKKSYVINGDAVELPKPPYPQLARLNRIQGMVSVQVLIDESGKVIAAHAVSGSTFLTNDAVKAAYRARFSPTKIGDQPVKVSGTITYNFVLQP
jgi:TonB family protein